ncbi:Membrane-fusion protein-like protein [Shewanella sediminis HAW-EB3]|uniref:Membrane-fusion protein-like protein n=1 Tax=Shewanella sediminis (strain HAW-EB3) TaxID=425104 RepID=A8FT10_SHESH|nr:efflux RND transporter periplasmic adaptor subunit [Shewanella sediminis]ABV35983.1 Membrane-fusion protein-like protein [Shewanella sediminis HAW-EB3]
MKNHTLVALVALSPTLALCTHASELDVTQVPATQVSIASAKYQPVFQTKTYSTALTASERVQIIALTTGALEKKLVRNGQAVQEGDILIELEDIDYVVNHKEAMANVLLAKANLKESKSAYERAIKVRKHGDLAESTFDKMEAAFEAAKAQLELAKAYEQRAQIELDRTKIRASTNGKITALYVDEGQVLSRGEPISYIVNDTMIDAIVELPSNDSFIQSIDNLTAELIVNNNSYAQNGRLFAIDGAIDPSKGTLKVRYRFDNRGDLLDGQFAKVVLSNNSKKGNIAVPQTSVLTDRSGKFVYLVVDNKIHLQRVTSLGTHGLSEILDGLNEGDQVITSATMKLYPGLDVEIKG